jgi:preprotein translocase subunit SecG
MKTIFFLVQFVHYSVCTGLILIVLFQAGKSGGMAGIFGGGGSDQLFNTPTGTAFIKKFTVVIACVFLLTSLLLTKMSTNLGLMSLAQQLANVSKSPLTAVPTGGRVFDDSDVKNIVDRTIVDRGADNKTENNSATKTSAMSGE